MESKRMEMEHKHERFIDQQPDVKPQGGGGVQTLGGGCGPGSPAPGMMASLVSTRPIFAESAGGAESEVIPV